MIAYSAQNMPVTCSICSPKGNRSVLADLVMMPIPKPHPAYLPRRSKEESAEYRIATFGVMKGKGALKSQQIAEMVELSMPNVSNALRALAKMGYVKRNKIGYKKLTFEWIGD